MKELEKTKEELIEENQLLKEKVQKSENSSSFFWEETIELREKIKLLELQVESFKQALKYITNTL